PLRRRPFRRLRQRAAVLRTVARRRPRARSLDLPGERSVSATGSSFALGLALVGAFGAAFALLVLFVRHGMRYAAKHRERFEHGVGARMREAFLFVDATRLLALQHLITLSATLAAWWATGAWHAALAVALAAALLPRWALAVLR